MLSLSSSTREVRAAEPRSNGVKSLGVLSLRRCVPLVGRFLGHGWAVSGTMGWAGAFSGFFVSWVGRFLRWKRLIGGPFPASGMASRYIVDCPSLPGLPFRTTNSSPAATASSSRRFTVDLVRPVSSASARAPRHVRPVSLFTPFGFVAILIAIWANDPPTMPAAMAASTCANHVSFAVALLIVPHAPTGISRLGRAIFFWVMAHLATPAPSCRLDQSAC